MSQRLISTLRLGLEERALTDSNDIRTIFQRDYDRIIFSSPFRRMQNKTQVFPLPGSIFVHNRLTHSLEVASVGRSLGNMVANQISSQYQYPANETNEIGSVVAAACLAHDLGNPPFGHSGETAIANFFKKGKGKDYIDALPLAMQTDFTLFEGNANAFRLLCHQFNGKREGGFALTYSTLASIVKYPYESGLAGNKPKFGFFQSEKEIFTKVAEALKMKSLSEVPVQYSRYPLVYLVEAADDICYQVMDLEDAHKLKILSFDETRKLLLDFFDPTDDKELLETIDRNFETVTDRNERISYLRALVIGKLVGECASIFTSEFPKIIEGESVQPLIIQLSGNSDSAMKVVKEISGRQIYNDRSVIEIEIAGHKILGNLMEIFADATMSPDEEFSKKLILLMPEQYRPLNDDTYNRLQSVVDFISGMTDVYALDLYRKINGMNLPDLG